MNLRRAAVVVLIAAAAVVSGCGGDDDGEDIDPETAAAARVTLVAQLEQASDRLSKAYVRQDAEGVCAMLRPSQMKEQFPSEKACAKEFSKLMKAEKEKRKPFRMKDLVATDGGFLVTYENDPPGEIAFAKEDGKWYVDVSGDIQRDPAPAE